MDSRQSHHIIACAAGSSRSRICFVVAMILQCGSAFVRAVESQAHFAHGIGVLLAALFVPP